MTTMETTGTPARGPTTTATVQALCDQLRALDQDIADLTARQARLPELLAQVAGHPVLWLLIGRDGIDRAGGLGQVTGHQLVATPHRRWGWGSRRPAVAPLPELPGHCIQGPALMDHDTIAQVIARVDADALATYAQGVALVQEIHTRLAEQPQLAEAQATRRFVVQQLRWHEQQDARTVDTVVQGAGGAS